ncbi:protein of unknown function [Micropruina glycogenica]|uniref:Uncharacterized protein n=1 Tax=Micropruina glycogenica TaxID=75385 RepID=A0A2N9JL44_9ACTN|nr:protein of unknown function [Micropruina glycogenica]
MTDLQRRVAELEATNQQFDRGPRHHPGPACQEALAQPAGGRADRAGRAAGPGVDAGHLGQDHAHRHRLVRGQLLARDS